MEKCDVAIANSRGAILDVFEAAPERTDLSSYCCRRKCLRLWSAAVQPGHRGHQTTAVQTEAEIVLDQMKRCVEAAGSSLDRVVKCNGYCTPDDAHFGGFNEIYANYFPVEARIFVHVPTWAGPFAIEFDCVA